MPILIHILVKLASTHPDSFGYDEYINPTGNALNV